MARLHANMYPALNDDIITQLRTVDVNTVFDFVKQDDEQLSKFVGMSHEDVNALKKQIIEIFSPKIRTARQLLTIEENNIVSTGIPSLDKLLEGGLHAGKLYEICGSSSAGKTQICHSLAINVILKTDGIVHYIDTKRDFSAGRIQMILDNQNHADEEAARVMDQIRVTRVTNIHELLSVLYNLTHSSNKKDEKPIKLVIIDSIYTTILASSEDCDSFYWLSHVANVCRFIANELNCSVMSVNMLKEWRSVDGFVPTTGVRPVAAVKPTLGKFWVQAPNTRLIVEKLGKEKRIISVSKSLELEVGASCTVIFTDTGVT